MMTTHSRPVPRCALLALCLLLTSCVTKQLEPDFSAFSTAYARDMNWQMLLNLARLDQGHPAYFMTIGEIRITPTQSISLNTTATSNHTESQNVSTTITRAMSNILSGTFTPNASVSANPSFIFIPVNGTEAAKQLLEPISIEVFNTLYQQGWPVDQLLRVLVERIEIDFYDKVGDHTRLVLTNSPTRAESWQYFARFLRACEVVRELQKRGGLRLKSEELPLPPGSAGAGQKSGNGQKKPGNANPTAPKPTAPKAATDAPADDAAPAIKDDSAAPATHTVYQFISDKDILDAVLSELNKNPAYKEDQAADHPAVPPQKVTDDPDNPPLKNFRMVFSSTLTVGASPVVDPAGEREAEKKLTKQDELPPPKNVARTVLVLRSFRSVLDAVAQEQRAFAQLAGNKAFFKQIPFRQQRPVLQTDWTGDKRELLAPVADIKFGGQHYQITDLVKPETDPDAPAPDGPTFDSRWNRDVFRLLIDLSTQVNVDITKFQRQTLELTPP